MNRQPFPSMKLADWPPRDRELWLAARRTVGLFDDGGAASHWRTPTLRNCEYSYGVYLSWLSAGAPLYPDATPSDRVTRELIRKFIEAYAVGRSEFTVGTTVSRIAHFVRAACGGAHPWLTRLGHRLMNGAEPARPKLPRMARVKDLIELGEELMNLGLKDTRRKRFRGLPLYRDGLIIALLARRPMRRKNLCALRIGHSLVLDGQRVRIRFDASETKKGVPLDWPFPDDLVEPLDTYLKEVRPFLLRRATEPDEGWLWIGRTGRPLPDHNLTDRISKLTLEYLGRSVSPHLFRDCAATEIALEDPEHIGITKSLLGHATFVSSENHYNQATGFTAFARHHDVIKELRDDS